MTTPRNYSGLAGGPTPAGTPGTIQRPQLKTTDPLSDVRLPDTFDATDLTSIEFKACMALARVQAKTGAGWVTERQWRAFAVSDHADHSVRGFRLPELVAKGVVEVESALFHAQVPGQVPQPLAIYRIKRA